MYYRQLGKYRKIEIIDEVDGVTTFRYTLNFMSYFGVAETKDLIREEDLPYKAEIIKFREVDRLKEIQAFIAQRKANNLRRIAQKM